MKNKIEKSKMVAALVTIVLFGALATSMIYNSNLKNRLNRQEAVAGDMIAQKQMLENEMTDYKMRVQSLTGKNAEMDDLMSKKEKELIAKEAEIKKLIKNNADANVLKKQLADVKKMKEDMEMQVEALNLTVSKLKNENQNLAKQVKSLKSENEMMAKNIKILSSMNTDNMVADALKRKDAKNTVFARKANKLYVSFNLTQDVASNVRFKVTTPSGKVVATEQDGLSYKLIDVQTEVLTADASGSISAANQMKKVEMFYKPKEKLKSGTYTIGIYNGDTYLSSCQIRLR
jgi:chromosome segregation ATPase